MVMHDRARDIIGAATIGVGPWLPVRLSDSWRCRRGCRRSKVLRQPLWRLRRTWLWRPAGYAAPGYGGYAAPGYGASGCDPYYGCKPGRWTLLGPCVLQVEQPPPSSGNGVGSLPLRSIIAVCCARATGGHAAADPRILMNSRRPGVEP